MGLAQYRKTQPGLPSVTCTVQCAAMATGTTTDVDRQIVACPEARRATRAYVTFYQQITCNDTDYRVVNVWVYEPDGIVYTALAEGTTKATTGVGVLPSDEGVIPAGTVVEIPLADGALTVPEGGSVVVNWSFGGTGIAMPNGAAVSVTLEPT